MTKQTKKDKGLEKLTLSLDVIIPCYNTAHTLERAVLSVLQQSEVNVLWLIDDCSSDGTWDLIQDLRMRFGDKIQAFRLPENSGAAFARNVGVMKSQADLVAFLDADDEYELNALSAAHFTLHHEQFEQMGLIRLRMKPVGFPEKYTQHPEFARVWQILSMTVGGNMVFRRDLFLASGGFPQHEIFKKLGGEDAALGIAITRANWVGTLFEESEPAVLHYWRDGIHATRLLDAYLFGVASKEVTPEHSAQAEYITNQIVERLKNLLAMLRPVRKSGKDDENNEYNKRGILPLKVTRE